MEKLFELFSCIRAIQHRMGVPLHHQTFVDDLECFPVDNEAVRDCVFCMCLSAQPHSCLSSHTAVCLSVCVSTQPHTLSSWVFLAAVWPSRATLASTRAWECASTQRADANTRGW